MLGKLYLCHGGCWPAKLKPGHVSKPCEDGLYVGVAWLGAGWDRAFPHQLLRRVKVKVRH